MAGESKGEEVESVTEPPVIRIELLAVVRDELNGLDSRDAGVRPTTVTEIEVFPLPPIPVEAFWGVTNSKTSSTCGELGPPVGSEPTLKGSAVAGKRTHPIGLRCVESARRPVWDRFHSARAAVSSKLDEYPRQ